MSRSYLIDGYNLLHAMGAIKGKLAPGGLLQARTRLVGLLAGAFNNDASCVTVVFDASGSSAGEAEHNDHGITVRFALGFDQADDLIEELIRQDSVPKNLVVVSDDHRLQSAARRRGAESMSSGDFLDHLSQLRKQRPVSTNQAEEKVQSEKEKEEWLKEFGDLESDPKLREFFENF